MVAGTLTKQPTLRPTASIDLYWIPLGAGDRTGLVSPSGWLYERAKATLDHRRPQLLFHSALLVDIAGERWAIEMAPAWGAPPGDRGVQGEGSVGLSGAGRWRIFRYEVRCWRDGSIPDIEYAVGGATRIRVTPEEAEALLLAVPDFPCRTWGLDELGTGDMWNSNSLVSWLLTSTGHDVRDTRPPDGGRAPGWRAGVCAARAMERAS